MDETAAEAHLHRSLQQAREAVPWKLDGLGEYDARRDAETPRRRDAGGRP